jgi:hypothetical protein
MRLQGCLIDADPLTSATTAAGTLAVWSKELCYRSCPITY